MPASRHRTRAPGLTRCRACVRRGLWAASLAALVSVGAQGSPSLAASANRRPAYRIDLSVPGSVAHGKGFSFSVSGFAATKSVLAVLLDSRRCAGSAQVEASTHRFAEKDFTVRGRYGPLTLDATATARQGRQFVCAYLLLSAKRPLLTRAHATTSYLVSGLATWVVKPGVDTQSGLMTGIACASSSLCVATDGSGDVVSSSDPSDGRSARWAVTNVDGDAELQGISCPSLSLCVAVDQAGNVLTSTDPGAGASATWTVKNVAGLLYGVSCPSSSLCVATDGQNSVLVTTDPGAGASATWTMKDVDPGAGNALSGISCPSRSLCVAVDGAGKVLTSNDPTAGASATWAISRVDPPGPSQGMQGISCGSVSLCAAIDYAGNVLTSTDPSRGASATWAIQDINNDTELWAISCAPTALCVATDGNNTALVSTDPNAGATATWTAYPNADPVSPTGSDPGLGSISCPSVKLCVAVDGEGSVITSTDPAGG